MDTLKTALAHLRPRYRQWPDGGTSFWHALIEQDPALELPGPLPAAWLPALYEALGSPPKARGVFYTPRPLADFLAAQTLGRRLARHYRAMRRHPEQRRDHLDAVLALRVLDPACGAGVFLEAALERLTAFYRRVRDLPGLEISLPDCLSAHAILERQLDGVDLDPVALMLARTLLARRAAELDGIAAEPVLRLRAGDALSLPEGDFCWRRDFPDIPAGWDYILGNPPYMTEVRGASGLLDVLRGHPLLSACYAPKMDVCDAFVGLSAALLKPGGELGMVLPDYWRTRSGSGPLREALWQGGQIRLIWQFGETRVFQRAPGHHTSLLVWQKHPQPPPDSADASCLLGQGPLRQKPQPALLTYDNARGPIRLGPPPVMTLLERLERQPLRLQAREVQQGIILPQGRLRDTGAGVFLLDEAEVGRLDLSAAERACLRPYYEVGDFAAGSGFSRPPAWWIIYTDRPTLRAWAEKPGQYARLRAHLDRFAAINTSSHAPYGLHRARQPVWFEDPGKILCARQTLRPRFAQVAHPAYVGEGFYSLRVTQAGWRDHPAALAALLNSRLAWFWFAHHKRKGARLQIDKDVLLGFPLPPWRAAFAHGLDEPLIYAAYGLEQADIHCLERTVAEIAGMAPP